MSANYPERLIEKFAPILADALRMARLFEIESPALFRFLRARKFPRAFVTSSWLV